MITGIVTANREAVIEVDVAGPGGDSRRIRAVIDSGYTGFLTLPARMIAKLCLQFHGYRRGWLADHSEVQFEMFIASVLWQSEFKEVLVAQAEGSPLVGMSLLQGNRLTVDAVNGGSVRIEQLSQADDPTS
jgi:clan AA aspartic protease